VIWIGDIYRKIMKNDKRVKLEKPDPKKQPPGNRTPAPVDYQDPTGSKENIHSPKNSGYDEKQPVGK
jgi:hypothetical protein